MKTLSDRLEAAVRGTVDVTIEALTTRVESIGGPCITVHNLDGAQRMLYAGVKSAVLGAMADVLREQQEAHHRAAVEDLHRLKSQ